MKNLFLAILALSVLSSCNMNSPSVMENGQIQDYYQDSIHYKVFTSGSGDIFIVNVTKDSLDYLVAKNTLALDTLNTKYKAYFLEALKK